MEMNVKNIMVTKLIPKKYNRRNGFLDFRSKAKTPEEKEFLELYYEAHKALNEKTTCTPICKRILEHIDSIFDMTQLKNKDIAAVRIITGNEIKCLQQTTSDIRSLKNGSDYKPSCDGLMDKIHRENLVKDEKVLMKAIEIVDNNSQIFNKLTRSIRQVTQDEFSNLLLKQVNRGAVQKVKSLSVHHVRVLFDFIDTNIINKDKASRNYLVSAQEMDNFMEVEKRTEKLSQLINNNGEEIPELIGEKENKPRRQGSPITSSFTRRKPA
jgi:hypothetical protein